MTVVATLARVRADIPVKPSQRFELAMHPPFAHFRGGCYLHPQADRS
jgi:hypothetical protein